MKGEEKKKKKKKNEKKTSPIKSEVEFTKRIQSTRLKTYENTKHFLDPTHYWVRYGV